MYLYIFIIIHYNDTGGEWIYLGQAGSSSATISSIYGRGNISGIFAIFINSNGTVLDYKIDNDIGAMSILDDQFTTDSGEACVYLIYGTNNYAAVWMRETSIIANTYSPSGPCTVKVYIKPKT